MRDTATHSGMFPNEANLVGTLLDKWRKLRPSEMRGPVQFNHTCKVGFRGEATMQDVSEGEKSRHHHSLGKDA